MFVTDTIKCLQKKLVLLSFTTRKLASSKTPCNCQNRLPSSQTHLWSELPPASRQFFHATSHRKTSSFFPDTSIFLSFAYLSYGTKSSLQSRLPGSEPSSLCIHLWERQNSDALFWHPEHSWPHCTGAPKSPRGTIILSTYQFYIGDALGIHGDILGYWERRWKLLFRVQGLEFRGHLWKGCQSSGWKMYTSGASAPRPGAMRSGPL